MRVHPRTEPHRQQVVDATKYGGHDRVLNSQLSLRNSRSGVTAFHGRKQIADPDEFDAMTSNSEWRRTPASQREDINVAHFRAGRTRSAAQTSADNRT